MAISLASIARHVNSRAPLVVIHGSPGARKTTFASQAPNPVFIRTEDGLGSLQVDTFPMCESFDDVMAALAALYEDHEYKTVVIDSLSALEPLIWDKVARDHQVTNLESIGFGKGYVFALNYWRELIQAIKGLSERRIMPVLIAHSEVARFDAPDVEPYDRHQIKLHKRAFHLLYEQADIIGHAFKPVFVRKEEGQKTGKAKAKGDHQLRLVETPSAIAKNRYQMPETIALDWAEFAEYLPPYNQE